MILKAWLILSLATPCFGATLEGISFPDTVPLEKQQLVLNGMGVRKYSVFKVQVYVAALYLLQKQTSEASILKSMDPKVVQMRFKRAVEEQDMRDAWMLYLKENAGAQWEAMRPAAEKYVAMVPAVKEGDTLVHEFTADKTTLKKNDQKVGELSAAGFPALLLSTWIGEKPTTQEMKQGLLGLTP